MYNNKLLLQIDADDVWGWMVYTILIGGFFAFVKSINYRLHKLFGTDPLILKEEEEKKDDTTETEDKENATDENKQDVPAAPQFHVEPYPTKMDELQQDINVEVHKSASSLNSTTDRTSMDTSGGTELSTRRSPGSRRTSRRSSPKADSRDINAIEVAIAETVCKIYLLPRTHIFSHSMPEH